MIRTGLYSGLTVELENLEEILKIYLDEEQTKPKTIVIHQYDDYAIDHQQLTTALNVPVSTELRHGEVPVNKLAQGSINTKINLLQGKFRGHSKHRQTKTLWKLSFALFIIWIALIIINTITQYSVYSHRDKKLNNAITKLYLKKLPWRH